MLLYNKQLLTAHIYHTESYWAAACETDTGSSRLSSAYCTSTSVSHTTTILWLSFQDNLGVPVPPGWAGTRKQPDTLTPNIGLMHWSYLPTFHIPSTSFFHVLWSTFEPNTFNHKIHTFINQIIIILSWHMTKPITFQYSHSTV